MFVENPPTFHKKSANIGLILTEDLDSARDYRGEVGALDHPAQEQHRQL